MVLNVNASVALLWYDIVAALSCAHGVIVCVRVKLRIRTRIDSGTSAFLVVSTAQQEV